MIKTQIQMPEALYRKARRVAEEHEWSLAEVVRRGLEYITEVYPSVRETGPEWAPPKPRKLGWRGLTGDELRRVATETTAESSLKTRKARRALR